MILKDIKHHFKIYHSHNAYKKTFGTLSSKYFSGKEYKMVVSSIKCCLFRQCLHGHVILYCVRLNSRRKKKRSHIVALAVKTLVTSVILVIR